MKALITTILLLFAIATSQAQQTVTRSNIIAQSITEKFSVLKENKKIRHGAYQGLFNSKLVAEGNYTQGKRSGNWNFYNTKGKLVQTYNYDEQKLSFLDSADTKNLKYFMEAGAADTVTAPVKIGGGSYAMMALILSRMELSQNIHRDAPGATEVYYTHTLTLNEQGQIVAHQVKAVANNKLTYSYNLDDSAYDPEIARFIPATVNHKLVMCKVSAVTYSKMSGALTQSF